MDHSNRNFHHDVLYMVMKQDSFKGQLRDYNVFKWDVLVWNRTSYGTQRFTSYHLLLIGIESTVGR